ncbi:hypothetical protein BU14_0022s0088 [Porphyra umbilicalis]|uniref:Smr domain-containing protein n=1 Tax=Porphyra umbilicalis TaxID=2786 RepID=A0A1X6PKJ2_PORUM|nr:hypothetical protein BU14_0022s0088 [Porphyra umbilicalis]|eukprot:OSX81369.1 hypothetical protein BU14_0022s0088 [Porphyra umbilicalis]
MSDSTYGDVRPSRTSPIPCALPPGAPPHAAGATSAALPVPKAQHGRVIGPGGATIAALRRETGAAIEVPPKASAASTITVRGSAAAVAAAVDRITALVAPPAASSAGDRLRDEAGDAGAERGRLAAAASAAYARGDKAAAHTLSVASKAAGARADAAHGRAASAIFQAANAGMGRGEVDLHGLTVREALGVASRRVDALRPGERLRLITGAGRHSGPGGPKVKPAVEELLRARRVRYVADGPGAHPPPMAPPHPRARGA